MADDLEETQSSFAPQTQDELEEMLVNMGSSRPTRTFGATLSPTLKDELGNPVPVDARGEPIYFEANPEYDPDAKPSFANARENLGEMVQGVKDFAQAPLDGIAQMGRNVADAGADFANRAQTGNTTLGDVFGTLSAMIGFGPATSVTTKGLKATGQDLANPSMSRIFLTPETPNLSEDQLAGYVSAKDMAEQGADPLAIKQKTGWENLAGKEWVFEIDDSSAETLGSAQLTNPYREVEITRPGGTVSGQERRGLLLQAQREMIDLKKQLKSGAIDQDMYDTLAEARQRSLEADLSVRTSSSTTTKQVPVAPSLKSRGTLAQTLYHPELAKYVPSEMSGYTAKVGTINAPETETGITLGDHDSVSKHINVYRQDNKNPDKIPGIGERRGTMVHEVQHMVDSASNSVGTGFNKSRSKNIRDQAIRRFNVTLTKFAKNKLQDTVDTLDILVFGPKVTDGNLTRMIDESIVYDSAAGLGLLDEDMLKASMQAQGFTDVDQTFRYMKEARPEVYTSLQEYADILSSRDRRLSEMSDFEIYELELGEIKARLADNRSRMDPVERANSLATSDIRKTDQKIPVDLSLIFTPDEFDR